MLNGRTRSRLNQPISLASRDVRPGIEPTTQARAVDHALRGIIFDLGNTLMYFDGDWEATIRQGAINLSRFLVRHGVPIDADRLADSFLAERQAGLEQATLTGQEVTCGQVIESLLTRAAARPGLFDLVPRATRVYFELEEAAWTAYPAARATLRSLQRQGYRLGVLSNATDDPLIQRLVNRLGLRPYLSPVFSSAKLGWRKPKPQAFEAILSRWNLPAESVLMVGDTLDTDIKGAHDVGMRAVLIAPDEQISDRPDQNTIQPEATIRSIGELPALLETWRL